MRELHYRARVCRWRAARDRGVTIRQRSDELEGGRGHAGINPLPVPNALQFVTASKPG